MQVAILKTINGPYVKIADLILYFTEMRNETVSCYERKKIQEIIDSLTTLL